MFAENIKLQTHVQYIRNNINNPEMQLRLLFKGAGLLFYGLSVFYLGSRGWLVLQDLVPLMVYAFSLSVIAVITPVFAFTFDQGQASRWWIKALAYTGFYWLAFFVYSMILMLGIDGLRLINTMLQGRLLLILPQAVRPDMHLAVSLVGPLSLILLLIGTILARSPKVRLYQIQLEKEMKMNRPLRIAFLSDLHIGSLVSTANIDVLADRVNQQNPDIILLGGDLIDNSLNLIRDGEFIPQMKRLKAKLGVFAVLGNHELVNSNPADIAAFLEIANIRLLQDERIDFPEFTLVGRMEHQPHHSDRVERLTPSALLESVNRQKPVLLIQHQPVDLDYLARMGTDLTMAGHTHRGQLFPLNLLQKKQYAQTRRYQKRGRLHSLISDGYGTWGPPVRIGSRSEILMLELSGN